MNTIEPTAELSLGQQLKQAREALKLSLEDVAKEIALRPSILQQLENDEFVQKNVPATFMKGYVRSYAKFLRLPDSAWANVAFGETQKNDLGKNARATRAVNQYSSHNRWVGTLTVVVLLIVAAMTGIWWWQNYQQANQERDNLVQNYVAKDAEKDNSLAVPATSASETTNSNANVNNPENTMALPAAAPAAETPVAQNTPAAMPAESNEIAVAAAPLPKAETFNESAPATAPATESVTSTVEEPSLQPAPPAAQGDLVIEITQNSSWISVKDKNRKVLAQKEYKQGETLSFSGDDYSVIIGAPGNVRITYKGKDYPLKVDGRIAKFKLPQ